jgi:single-strand DNA-binding protein
MRSVNKVILIGNLTRDPEIKQTQNGQAVVTFGIATNREWMTSGSDRKKSTEFHEIVAWARLAELCHKYLRKGKLVYLEGYLKTRSWEVEGGKRFRTEIVLQDMIMLEKRAKDDEVELDEAAPQDTLPGPDVDPDLNADNIF